MNLTVKKTPDSEDERCEVSHLSLNWAEQIMITSFRSWLNNPTVWVCVERRGKKTWWWFCVCWIYLWKVSFYFRLIFDRWSQEQHGPFMTISCTHIPLFPSWLFFFSLLISIYNILNLLNIFLILVFLTCWEDWLVLHTVCWRVKCVGSLMDECAELAWVKNTERWVSLPRIQIGNFGDLRNAPTWVKHTQRQKKEHITNEGLFLANTIMN